MLRTGRQLGRPTRADRARIAVADARKAAARGRDHFGATATVFADVGLTAFVTPPIQVGAGPFSITLTHRYQFEFGAAGEPENTTRWDGGIIEISEDNGANWTTIGASAYDGVINGASGNPLEGQSAFSGTSTGYPATMIDTINLGTSCANDAVKLRFTIGTDSAAGAAGWEIHKPRLRNAHLSRSAVPQRFRISVNPNKNTGARADSGVMFSESCGGGSTPFSRAVESRH